MTSFATKQFDPLDGLRDDLQGRIHEATLELPVIPAMAHEVLKLSADPSQGVMDLAKLIQRDATLCAHLLRAANSPLYGISREIVSVRQAVSVLGTDTISQIAMSVALQSAVFGTPIFHDELRQCWKYSLAAGFFAKEIARALRANVESSFLCGIMANIGEPVVLTEIARYCQREGLPHDVIAPSVMEIVAEFNHKAGHLLAIQWRLPAVVQATVAFDPSNVDLSVPSQEHVDTILASQLAVAFAVHTMTPDLLDEETLRQHPQVADLSIYPEVLEVILARRDAIGAGVNVLS